MPQQPHIRFIVNPTSGPRRHVDVAAGIRLNLDHRKYSHDVVQTTHAGHAPELARQAAVEGCAVVVAVGGDGTVNEVARGLLHTDTALAILPKGSGNGLARHLKIPLQLERALYVLNQGHSTRIDSGTINEHPFFTTAGIGFDAYISSVFAGNEKRGLKTYAKLVLQELGKYKHLPVQLSINGEQLHSDCFVLAFANAAQYGNNAYIAPLADIRDGLLDVCLVRQMSVLKALNLGYSMLTKQLAHSGSAAYFKSAAVQVVAGAPMMYHTDGEYIGEAANFEITMDPLSLKVITPLT